MKKYGIRVNCIMPSVINTHAKRKMFSKADSSKWVDPGEIAEVILWLVSDYSKPVSGASIPDRSIVVNQILIF